MEIKFDYAANVWSLFVINSMWLDDASQRAPSNWVIIGVGLSPFGAKSLPERTLTNCQMDMCYDYFSLEFQYSCKMRYGFHWALYRNIHNTTRLLTYLFLAT